ncbi:hypothetical protein D3C71_2050680 [compost metagenome]
MIPCVNREHHTVCNVFALPGLERLLPDVCQQAVLKTEQKRLLAIWVKRIQAEYYHILDRLVVSLHQVQI